MAESHLTKPLSPSIDEGDPMTWALVYRLRRDALTIVANLNRGRDLPNMEAVKRQLVFVQGQLCLAALADPRLPSPLKTVLLDFHGATVHENIDDRRCTRRRHGYGQVAA